MRVPNEPNDNPGGPFADLLRLQTEFQARLAEETIGYLRRLQGAASPAAPGTVLVPDPAGTLEAEGPPGGSITLRVELENRQRVHCMVRPLLGELVSPTGVAWQPDADAHPSSRLVAPGELSELAIEVKLPGGLPPATYRGSLLLLGFRKGAIPVAITAAGPAGATEPAAGSTAIPADQAPARRRRSAKPGARAGARKPAAKPQRDRATGARDDPEGPA